MAAKTIDLKTLALSAAVILVVESVLHLAADLKILSPVLLIGAARVVEGLLILGVVRLRCQDGAAAIGLSARGIAPGIRQGLIWSAAFGLLVLVVSLAAWLLAGINTFARMRAGSDATVGALILFLVVGGIVSPVAEEIAFRGVLYGYLRRWGAWAAIALSSLLFVLAHAATGGFPLAQTVGGILFALAYERERNLFVPMVIHILGNLAIFSISLF